MSKTKIEWCDRTWNPITGCSQIAPGCKNCFSKTMTKRLKAMGQEKYKHGFDKVVCHESELVKPLKWKKPAMVFVCSMADLFHKDVSFGFIDEVLDTIKRCPRHNFQLLTKRPERMHDFFKWSKQGSDTLPLGNLWIGTSVSTQADADKNIPWLLKTPAKVRFISAEPLLEKVNFPPRLILKPDAPDYVGMAAIATGEHALTEYNGIHQIIVGCESGHNRRPFDEDWATHIKKICQFTKVKFFYKQGRDADDKVVKLPELDGRQWMEMPEELKI